MQTQIVQALAAFGISDVAFYPVPETDIIAIRITDQPYRDHRVAEMVAREIVAPVLATLGLTSSGFASNARYADDDKLGAVIFVR
jgi:hypothetical protein